MVARRGCVSTTFVKPIIALVALLASGCATAAQESAPLGSVAQPFSFAEDTELIDFAYGYPAEAAALPALTARLQSDFASVRGEALSGAQSDRSAAAEGQWPYRKHYLHKSWTTLGRSDRLLSLVGHIESYTGGAHGITGFATLLWDSKARSAVDMAQLFADPNAVAREMRGDYCAALDAERLKRRQGERFEGEFARCPDFSELSVAPADGDEDGRFDTVQFLAGPYVAGPYVEGEYEVALPIPTVLLNAVKPEYRAGFEAQPQ